MITIIMLHDTILHDTCIYIYIDISTDAVDPIPSAALVGKPQEIHGGCVRGLDDMGIGKKTMGKPWWCLI